MSVNYLTQEGKGMPEDGYSKKAEENMMNLIEETEISKKKNRNSLSIIFVTVITAILVGGLTIVSSGGISMSLMLFDWPTLLPMLLVTIFFLLGTRLGGPFVQAFLIVTGKKKNLSEDDLVQGRSALRLASSALLGILYGMFGYLLLLPIRMKLEAISCVEVNR